MSETYEHNLNDHEDPMGGPTWLVAFVGTIILIVIVLAVTAVLKFTESETVDAAVIDINIADLTAVQQRDYQRLHAGPRVVEDWDELGGEITRLVIPIDDAMQKVAEDWSRGASVKSGS